jgi:hypothetical protein
VNNNGSAPTTGPVDVLININNPDSKFAIAVWETTIHRPFLGTETITLYNQEMDAAPIKGATMTVFLSMRCPSEQYDLVSDADSSNDMYKVILPNP